MLPLIVLLGEGYQCICQLHIVTNSSSTLLFFFFCRRFVVFITWETLTYWSNILNLIVTCVDQFYPESTVALWFSYIWNNPVPFIIVHLNFQFFRCWPDFLPFVSLTLRNWKERRKLQPEVDYYLYLGLTCLTEHIWRHKSCDGIKLLVCEWGIYRKFFRVV